MSRKKILLVRHGETEWNSLSRFQGQIDIPLNDEGLRQARRLSARFEGWGPSVIYSSPLSRARKTAELIAVGASQAPFVLLDGLAEMGFGSWEGRSIREVESEDPGRFKEWMNSPFECPPPEGEPHGLLEKRVRESLEEITSAEGERMVVVSHGGILRIILALLFDIPLSTVWRMRVTNCSVTGVHMKKDRYSLAFLNDDLHVKLSEEGAKGLPFPA